MSVRRAMIDATLRQLAERIVATSVRHDRRPCALIPLLLAALSSCSVRLDRVMLSTPVTARRAEPQRSRIPSTAARRRTSTTITARVSTDPYRWLEKARRRADAAAGSRRRTRSRSRISKAIPARERDQAAPDGAVELRALRHSRASAATATSTCATTACRTRACCTWPTRSTAQPRVLLDPNTLSKDATVALGEFVPSPDGKLLAYSLSDGGTDWRTWHFRDVATGTRSAGRAALHQVRAVSWTADSRALYYARYPLRADGTGDDTQADAKSIWHRLGAASQDADRAASSRSPIIRRAIRTCRFPTTAVT